MVAKEKDSMSLVFKKETNQAVQTQKHIRQTLPCKKKNNNIKLPAKKHINKEIILKGTNITVPLSN